jgi:rhodanese-related sulfurtransferase
MIARGRIREGCLAMTVTVDELLARARRTLDRVQPADVPAALAAGAVLVDIRSDAQRAADGVVPGAVRVARNVLEWRCDPASRWRHEEISDPARQVILLCDGGYQSSLAAATLQELGLPRATDVDGGFQAWRAAGMPVEPARRTVF